MVRKASDPGRQKRIMDQCDAFAELLNVDAEGVMHDGDYGVALTPDQADKVLTLALTRAATTSVRVVTSTGTELARFTVGSVPAVGDWVVIDDRMHVVHTVVWWPQAAIRAVTITVGGESLPLLDLYA